MSQTSIVMLVVAPLLLWRMYSRVKRLTTRQESKVWRHMTALILFPLMTLALALAALAAPMALATLAAGLAIGAVLATIALKSTVFETVDGKYFFTPHARIGLAVSMVFIARVLYRFYDIYANGPAQQPDLGHSPLTMVAFGLMAGYYTLYAAALMRWRRAQNLKPAASQ